MELNNESEAAVSTAVTLLWLPTLEELHARCDLSKDPLEVAKAIRQWLCELVVVAVVEETGEKGV